MVLEIDHARLVSGYPDWDVAAVVESMGAGAAEFAEGDHMAHMQPHYRRIVERQS
jgi:hypothetical protein